MVHIALRRVVDLTPDELFSVAADIEAYPQFLPNCVATRIRRRQGHEWLVDNVFRWGPVPIRFRTRATLDAPHGIDIKSIDSLLIDLELKWRFLDHADGCEVLFEMSLRQPGPKLGLFERAMRLHAEATERAFISRADSLRQKP